MGISKAMLYGYRSGANRITNKVWLKLEAAERAAGIKPGVPGTAGAVAGDAESSGNPKDISGGGEKNFRVGDEAGEYPARGALADLERRLARMERILAGVIDLQAAGDALAELKSELERTR
jgi:hypothetical protein